MVDLSLIFNLSKDQGKTITHPRELIGRHRAYLFNIAEKDLAVPLESPRVIADDLGTTAEYLTWQTGDPLPTENENSVSGKPKVILSGDERRPVENYRSLNKQGQGRISQSMTAAEYKKSL